MGCRSEVPATRSLGQIIQENSSRTQRHLPHSYRFTRLLPRAATQGQRVEGMLRGARWREGLWSSQAPRRASPALPSTWTIYQPWLGSFGGMVDWIVGGWWSTWSPASNQIWSLQQPALILPESGASKNSQGVDRSFIWTTKAPSLTQFTREIIKVKGALCQELGTKTTVIDFLLHYNTVDVYADKLRHIKNLLFEQKSIWIGQHQLREIRSALWTGTRQKTSTEKVHRRDITWLAAA